MNARDRALRLQRRLRTSVAAGGVAAVVALGFAAEHTHAGTSKPAGATSTSVNASSSAAGSTSAGTNTSTSGTSTSTSSTSTSSTPPAVSSGSGNPVVVSGGS
ncbi:MAG: hypothetical protein E6I55_06410 [Chloroflexi bacterium]|nr:MAG: hypothetical protein E6I55_06410 [Chloroflexota bacterium]